MADLNSIQIILLVAIIAAILISGNSMLMLIGGVISIIGLAFVFSPTNETIVGNTPNKNTITVMNSREVKSNGEVITHEQRTETNSNTSAI